MYPNIYNIDNFDIVETFLNILYVLTKLHIIIEVFNNVLNSLHEKSFWGLFQRRHQEKQIE